MSLQAKRASATACALHHRSRPQRDEPSAVTALRRRAAKLMAPFATPCIGRPVYIHKPGGDEFDPDKDAVNVANHGVSLARTAGLDIHAFVEDTRPGDGERRFRLYGLIDGLAHCGVVTFRGTVVRAISLRRASRTERKRYDLFQR